MKLNFLEELKTTNQYNIVYLEKYLDFINNAGKIVVYSITTKERKVLPKNHPDILSGLYVPKKLLSD